MAFFILKFVNYFKIMFATPNFCTILKTLAQNPRKGEEKQLKSS